MSALRLVAVIALASAATAATAAGAAVVRVDLAGAGPGVRRVPGGVAFDPGAALLGVSESGGWARLAAGEDGLPVVALELPLPEGAGAATVSIEDFTPGRDLLLEGPLLAPAREPAGEGAPAPRAARPAPAAGGPAVLAAEVVRARGSALLHVLVRAGWHDGARLHLAGELRLTVTPIAGAAPPPGERLPGVAARYALARGGTRAPVAAAEEPLRPFAPPLRPTADGSPVEVVIVTSEALRPEFERLAHFRTRLGLRAAVRTVEWIDAAYAGLPGASDRGARLRTFLAEARERWGTLWVLLGGDTGVIPARYAISTYFVEGGELIPADLYYAALDGDWNADGDDRIGEAPGEGEPGDEVDLVPDLMVGRAPVSSREEARDFVERQISYELGSGAGADGRAGDPDYPASVLFLAEELFESLDGAEIAEEARGFLPPTMRVERLYENAAAYPGSSPLSAAAALAALERGPGVVEHVGHGFRNTLSVGSGTLGNAEADGLENRPRLPVFLALNCTSAAFDFNSIGERLIKNPRGGAIVYVGSSRYAFPGTARLYQAAFFAAAFQDSLPTVGEALLRVRSLLAPLGVIEGAHRWTQLALTLLGDPLTPLFRRPPEHLVLSQREYGSDGLLVRVTAGPAPVPGARVALLTADQVLSTAETDQVGEAVLPVPAAARAPYLLSASAQAAWPALSGLVEPGAGGAYLEVREVRVDDSAGGDGDRIAEAGETVGLVLEIENLGGAAAPAARLALSLLSGPATVIDGEAQHPALSPGETAAVGSLALRIAGGAADGAVLVLEVELGEGMAARTVRRTLQAAAPSLRVETPVIDGNGAVEPGETVRYRLTLANDGGGTARAVTAAASVVDAASGEPSPDAIVLDGRARFGDLRRGESTTGDPVVFTLAPAADPAALRLAVTITWAPAGERRLRLDFTPPAAPSAPRTRGSESSITVGWTATADPDLLGFEVERAPAPAGPFAPVVARPLAAAFLADPDLPALATFTYRVAAVDSSGNRGPWSAAAEGTTNPALHAGWPVAMGQETASSPVLADLDRDGAAEIVTGADAIYVWHGDGSELRDGDGSAITSGVFALDGVVPGRRGFHSVPAVADLDRDGDLDLVGAAWEQAQVFAWHRDGSLLPGWPRSLGGPPNWGSPAVGDLDGDGAPEVVVVGGAAGTVYAWHADGREVRDGDGDPGTDGVLVATAGAAYSFASPALGDLDGDGRLEVVVGLDEPAGRLHALRAAGGEAPGWPVELGGRISASPALGDLDGDGRLEVAIAVEDDSLHVLRADGTPAPGWPRWAFLEHAGARTSSPVLADLDADGRPEVILAENSGPTHTARLRVFRPGGTILPGFEDVTFATDPEATAARATQSTPVVGDVDGDGRPEILLGAEDGRLYGFDDDGTPAAGFPIQTGGEVRGSAALGDVDGDGLIEVVVAGWDKNLYVWDLAGAASPDRLPWPFFRRDAANRGNLALAAPPAGGRPAPPLGATFDGMAQLLAPWPNPANPGAAIAFVLPRGGQVRLALYGVDGRVVRRLEDGQLAAGRHECIWDGRTDLGDPAPSGVYWLRLAAPGGTAARRLVVLR